MSEAIQVSLDSQGRIVIPSTFRKRLGLAQGMMLVVEAGEQGELCLRVQQESPTLVDKEGVLVVRARPNGDLVDIAQLERDRHVSEMVQRVGL